MGVKRTMMEDSFKPLAPNRTEPEVEDLNSNPIFVIRLLGDFRQVTRPLWDSTPVK